MNPQIEFLKYTRLDKGMLACDEVSHYGCRADILAVDKYKKHIVEYEFKNNSYDLKVAEKRKSKYQLQKRNYKDKYVWGVKGTVTKEPQQPHRFYFVIPQELYEKEEDYLKQQKCGVIIYYMTKWSHGEHIDFKVIKRCMTRKKNLQKYNVAVQNLLTRLSSAYVCLLYTVKGDTNEC